ncbi:hypothetical protein FRC17_011040 [Serendipita sp. 399]|nr:hypothetical protein FRC17_011040 [Serendipita sp. 399]
MRIFPVIISTVAFAQQALAHYRFLGLNGSGDFTYIRPWLGNTNAPVTDVLSTAIRCNTGAALTTGTLTVAAGSIVTFRVDPAITHPGPLLWYLAKAPSSVNGWDATGKVWFKFAQTGAGGTGSSLTWPTLGLTTVSARLPPSLRAGEYLLRVEHIGYTHTTSNSDEHYISCAQLRVTGGGTGNPGPLVAFPGAYPTGPTIPWDPPAGYVYTPPGPPVWQG